MKKACIIFAFTALVLATLACGSSTAGGNVVSTNAPSQNTPVSMVTHKVGEVIQVEDQNITLNSAKINGGVVQANFTVENIGSDSLTVSSLIDFEAKGDDGTKLELSLDCPASGLDGSVLPSDKLKGNICWKGLTSSTVRIYYTPNFLGDTIVVWEINQ